MIDIILHVLLNQWLFDISVLSDPWMYYPLLVPATVYISFMVIKWCILLMPIWLPIRIILDRHE